MFNFQNATSVMAKFLSRKGADFQVEIAGLARSSRLRDRPTQKLISRLGRRPMPGIHESVQLRFDARV